jgi:hypothetical protein
MVKLYKTGFYTSCWEMGRINEFSHTHSVIPSDDHKPYTLHTQCFDRGTGLNIKTGNKGIAGGSNGFYTHVVRGT